MDYQESLNFTSLELDIVPSILIVDDDEDNQLLLQYTIAMFGWTSMVAADATNAIQLANRQQPDLILLDIVIPDISGLQIAAILKQQKATSSIPIIAVTGLAELKEKNLILASGFDDYICKPFILDKVYQAIASNLSFDNISQTA